MRRFQAIAVWAAVLAVSAGAFGATATQVSQYGVTWFFSTSREVGQFVNGDWWVVGPVTITGYTPAPSGGMHGSMVNPEIGQGQAYDSRANQYNSSLLPSFPLTLSGGNSLVTVTSWTDNPDTRTDYIGKHPAASVTNIRTAAVLTVLSTAPPSDAFRPPYAGTTKTIFRKSDIDYSRLRRLAPANQTPGYDYEDVGYWSRDYSKTAAAQYARLFERVWILHVTDWSGRSTHPTENMPNYHREVYNVVATGAVLLLCDLDEIDKLLIPYLQIGIDSHYIIKTGGGDGYSDADSSIHKWPVLMAGTLFNNAAMKSNGYRYRTEWMSYYLVDRQSTVVSSIVPAGYTYNGYTVGWRQDPGNTEHEHLDPETEWGEEYVQIGGGGSKRETYRRINSHTWPGIALAAHLMGAVDDWNHPAFFDYMDRWMTEDEYFEGRSPAVGSTTSQFVSGMWDTYRDAGYSTLVMYAGDDQDITLPASATLDGDMSSSDPSSVTVTWSKVSGPGAVTFGDSSALDTTASFSTDGAYVLRLSGDDGENSDSDDVTIVVRPAGFNHDPVADAGPDQEVMDAGDDGSEPVTLNGGGSTDQDGTIVSYDWTESSTTIATGVSPLVSLSVGVHTITLEVADDDDGTDTDSVVITVLDAGAVTSTAVWQSFGLPAQTDVFTVEFDAAPNGSAIDALVGLSQGAAAAYADLATCIRFNTSGNIDSRDGDTYAASATVGYASGTGYHFRMVVNIPGHVFDVYVTPDGGSETLLANNFAFRNGATGVTTLDNWALYSYIGSTTVSHMEITQVSSNQTPVADAGTDQTVTDSDDSGSETVTLDGSGSYDPDGSILSYVWQESSSQIATGAGPSVNFTVGSHTVTLTVTDDESATDTDTVSITVNAPTGNAAPTADAGPNQSVSDSDDSGDESVTLDGSGSSDSDGTIESYVWKENGAQIATGSGPSVTLTVGVHTIELTVTDDDGATDTDTAVITVTAAPSGGGTVEETFESSATQATFDGTADLTWYGDNSGLELAAADWNGGNTFGGGDEAAARGKLDAVTVNRTIVTNVSSIFDDGEETTWTVYASGSNTAFQSSVGVAIILLADSNDASTIESPTQAFQGYKVEISDYGSGDAMRFFKSTDSDTGWVAVHTELFGEAKRVEHGWNLKVTRSASGLWTIYYANGAKGQTPTSYFSLTDTSVDTSGATWYSGMGLRCPASKSNMTGFDDFRVEGAGAGNIPPTAHAGPDQTVTDTDDSGSESVTLDGSGSSDSDGTISSYVWTENSSQIATGSGPSVSLSVGAHTIELTVTDNDSATDADTVVVTVNAYVNVPPVADAGGDQTVTDTDDNGSESVTLDGSGSADSDGTIVGYVWTESGVQLAAGSGPSVTFDVGVHTVVLTVTDDDAATDTDIVVITVNEAANTAPTADAGDDQTVTLVNGDTYIAVTLDGSGSSDSDGTITSYRWTANSVEIATGAGPIVQLDAGAHTITLTVTDNDGATDTDNVVITVNEPANEDPIADAGVNQTVHDTDRNGSEAVTLDGSDSVDPDGTIISYVWEENSSQIAAGESPDVTLSAGSHTITLTVTDDDDATDAANVTVLVNVPPIADAGDDQTVNDADESGSESVTLDAGGSSDSDGTISGYVWEENSSQIATGSGPSVSLAVGVHDIDLTVTDDDGGTDTDTVTVTITAYVNQPPTADAGSDQTVSDSDDSGSESVTLDAGGSSDSDGTISSYVWNENSSQIAVGSGPSVSFTVGVHTVELTVTDDDSDTDTDVVLITVEAYVNVPPTADAGGDQNVTDTDDSGDESVTLDGAGSSDSDGSISSYVWEEDSTQIATGSGPSVTLDVGVHTITLTVTDDDGATDTDTVIITVEAAPASGEVEETFESSSTQTTFDGTADLTWLGDYAAFDLVDADWPAGPDFGSGSEVALRSKSSGSDVYNTMVTDISDVMTTGQEMTWEVFGSGDSCAFQVSVRMEIILLADSSSAGTIESPTQAFQGYKLSITDRGDANDCIQLLRSTDSDSGWVVVDYEDFGVARRVENGWNLKVTRSSAGLWTIYYANGSKGTTPTLFFSVTDTSVDLSGETWYSGVGWRAPDSKSNYGGFDDFKVTGAASSSNEPPTADAGSDQTVNDSDDSGSESITLDGSGSSDTDGTIESYVWKESSSQIATGSGPSVSFNVGVHTVELTVTDDDDATDTDTVLITVTAYVNQAPTADAGSDQTVDDSDDSGSESVTLDGSGSSDPDGTISSYVWEEDSSQIATGSGPNVSLDVGVHTITLTVTDDDSATDTDTVVVAVTAYVNQPPTADAGGDQNVTDDNDDGSHTVALDGAGSTDSDGTISSYVWEEDSSQIATGSGPSVAFAVGTHTVELTVTDDDGATDTDTVAITVNAYVNLAPTADAGGDQTVTDSDDGGDESVTLDGAGSTDPDGTISSYVWEENNSQIATGSGPSVTFAVGVHTVELTVTDNDGATDTDTVAITVNPAPSGGTGEVEETFESSSTQTTFDGTADLTWYGDYASFDLAAADWPAGPDFGTSSEICLRSKWSEASVHHTMVTDISDIVTTSQQMTWEVFASGANTAIQSSVGINLILLADSSTAGTIESPTQAFQGYKIQVTDPGGGDCIRFYRSTDSDTGWVTVHTEALGSSSWVNHGWNLKVTRSSAGLWTVYYATGSKGTTPVSFFSLTDTNVDLSGSTWYSGVGWRAPSTKSDLGGFDDFKVTGAAGNLAPSANAGTDQTVIDDDGDGSAAAFLDASVSFDPDGAISSYVWEEDSAQIATGVNPSVSLDVGVHTVELTVTDDEAATDTDTVQVTVVSPTVVGSFDWQNFALPAQTGTFTVEFDAAPGASDIDGVFGLSYGEAYAYADQAAIVRFYVNGEIEAKNGDDYMNDVAVTYSSGTEYHIRMVINVATSTYDIYVTPDGQSEITLGAGYDFRTVQIGVGTLDTWSIRDYQAPPSVTISNLTITE